jgi:hypothetical protein
MSLLDLNLQHVDDPHFAGTWRVERRTLSRTEAADSLAEATHLHLQGREFRLDAPDAAHRGEWRIERDPLLSRPYLVILLAGQAIRALVTRLRRSLDGQYQALVLYFQSGLELSLVQP